MIKLRKQENERTANLVDTILEQDDNSDDQDAETMSSGYFREDSV